MLERPDVTAHMLICRAELPSLRKGPEHVAAKEWHLCDPSGRRHHFRNLRDFIDTHRELFTPRELEHYPRVPLCIAYHMLSALRPTRRHPVESWHGWTWAGKGN